MTPTPLLIFPYNGNGLEAVECLGSEFELVGFVDDTPAKHGTCPLYGCPVMDRAALIRFPEAKVLAVPGSPTSFRHRLDIIGQLGLPEARWATVVHPRAWVSSQARLGRNCLLMAGVVLTTDASIGDHVCILPNSVLHHGVTVGQGTLIGSCVVIAGGSRLGEQNYVGSGTQLIHGISIGHRNLIGLGSNVIRSLGDEQTVAGNPARPIPRKGQP